MCRFRRADTLEWRSRGGPEFLKTQRRNGQGTQLAVADNIIVLITVWEFRIKLDNFNEPREVPPPPGFRR